MLPWIHQCRLRLLAACAIALLAVSLCGARLAAAAAPAPVDAAMCQRMMARQVLATGAPVRCDQLRIVRFSYVDFDGHAHDDGEIMVLAAVAPHVREIFATLYRRRFPIAHARLMDHYQGDDAAAMSDNNTSGFNHRPVTGSNLPSLHAYGLAIDLNPIQNPYIRFSDNGQAFFSPPAGSAYANRLRLRPAKPERAGMAEEVVHIFAHHGFLVWGGYWDQPIDYQHFQVSRKVAESLASLPVSEGGAFFNRYVARFRACFKAGKMRHPGLAACAMEVEYFFS